MKSSDKSPTPPPSPKREAILLAAIRLFQRYGFRKTSIDLIATEAEVAKPTVYAHFADKDALYVAVCEHVMAEVLARAEAAKAKKGAVSDRLAAMVAAKFTTVFEIVHASAHASELLDSQNKLASRAVSEADDRFVALLVAELSRAAEAGELRPAALAPSLPEVARMLMQLGHGAGFAATTADGYRADIRRLMRAVLAAATPGDVKPVKKPASPRSRAPAR